MRPDLHAHAERTRRRIVHEGVPPAHFRKMLDALEPASVDAWVDALLGIDELPDDDPDLPRGCVPYLPCPVATIVEALDRAEVTEQDRFLDVGSGLGRVCVLSHLLTGVHAVGIEIQSGLVKSANAHATTLELEGIRYFEGDATHMPGHLEAATVVFMYCPFGRNRVDQVLELLRHPPHPVRVCCVGMPALDRPWLKPIPCDTPDLAVYRLEA